MYEPDSSRHGRARLNCVVLDDDSVEMVQVVEEVVDWEKEEADGREGEEGSELIFVVAGPLSSRPEPPEL